MWVHEHGGAAPIAGRARAFLAAAEQMAIHIATLIQQQWDAQLAQRTATQPNKMTDQSSMWIVVAQPNKVMAQLNLIHTALKPMFKPGNAGWPGHRGTT